MPSLTDVLRQLPNETQVRLRELWESLTPAERESLSALVKGLPSERGLLKLLVDLAATQVHYAFGNRTRVAIVGPANAGKSTLYNQFVRARGDRAQVSPIPGTTKVPQEADAGLFIIVDTPGADAAGATGEAERTRAMAAARAADFLIVLFDATQGVNKSGQELFSELVALRKPYVVALNKTDLVRRDLQKVLEQAVRDLDLKPDQLIPISAKEGENLERLLAAIALAEPALVAALGRAMPAYRWQLARRSIISAASLSAVIALAPLPMIDFLPLIATQSIMVLSIARIFNYEISFARAKELVATFGLGFLGRTLFAEVSKLGGVPGWLLAAAIASSTTVVMGLAAANWFERGERMSSEALRQATETLVQNLLAALRDLGQRKPDGRRLRDRIAQVLEDLPLAKRFPGEEPPQ